MGTSSVSSEAIVKKFLRGGNTKYDHSDAMRNPSWIQGSATKAAEIHRVAGNHETDYFLNSSLNAIFRKDGAAGYQSTKGQQQDSRLPQRNAPKNARCFIASVLAERAPCGVIHQIH